MSNLTERDRRRVAAEAEVDPRTVDKLLGGGQVRPLLRDRIVQSMSALGLDTPSDPHATATGRGRGDSR